MNKLRNSGLVLEGGSLRGLFSCGIIDVFLENGIEFDGMIGVSAGAAFGCNYKSRQVGRGYRYNYKYAGDKRYASISSWLKTGDLFNVDFCYNKLVKELDPFDEKSFRLNPMEFYCVATDISEGKPVYFKCKNGDDKDMLYMRASASIPIFSRPVNIDGKKYLDGGTSDSIPLKHMEELGYKKIVVIETQPVDYQKKPQKHLLLIKLILHKYPKLYALLKDRYLMYNFEKSYVRQKEEKGEVLVLRPSTSLNISSFNKDPNEITRVYNLGRECGLANLDRVKGYLNEV